MHSISEDDIKRALLSVASKGAEAFLQLAQNEPHLSRVLQESVSTCLTSIFGDAMVSSTHDIVVYNRAVANIQSLSISMFLLTRELYRDLSVRALEEQLALESVSGNTNGGRNSNTESNKSGSPDTNAGNANHSGGNGSGGNEGNKS